MTHPAGHDARGFRELYLEYFDHWNAQRFWEAHESLETLWRRTNDANRLYLQGMIQAAGAFYHIQRSRREPAIILFDQSLSYLQTYEPFRVWEGLRVGDFCSMLRHTRSRVANLPADAADLPGALPDYPTVALVPEYAAGAASSA